MDCRAYGPGFCRGLCSGDSKPLSDQVDKNLTFKDVFKNPDAHKGSVVIWQASL